MNHKILLPILALFFAILACNSPQPGETESPANKIEAKEAIQTYARDVLGLEIPNSMRAGGTAGEISLPVSLQDGVDVAVDLAGTTYFGVWSGGAASLSFGDGDVSGDFIADVRDGALGVFGVTHKAALPTEPAAAIALIEQVYPGLGRYEWEETTTAQGQGFSFSARQPENASVQSWSVELTGTTIRAGVAPGIGQNQSLVWVVLASGALASTLGQ